MSIHFKPLSKASAPECTVPHMFTTRGELMNGIDGLDANKVSALVAKIKTGIPEIKPLVDLHFAQHTSNKDQTGGKAKALLKRAVVLTVRTTADASKWQALIAGL